jgi:hypothetical protein
MAQQVPLRREEKIFSYTQLKVHFVLGSVA